MGSTKRANKRFYWLKFPEDFFKRNDIKVIESQKNGPAYVIFYLKLLTLSIQENGNLRLNEIIPFNEEMLATITGTDIDVVRTALKLFESLGLILTLEDQTLHMIELPSMTGSETQAAIDKRVYRAKIESEETLQIEDKKTMSDTCPKNVLLEIEIEKDLELELEKDIESGETTKTFTLSLAKNLFSRLKLTSDAKKFYHYYAARGWKFKDGTPIVNLEELAKTWDIREQEWNNSDKPKEIFTEELGNVIGG